jgi:hypothetical protein
MILQSVSKTFITVSSCKYHIASLARQSVVHIREVDYFVLPRLGVWLHSRQRSTIQAYLGYYSRVREVLWKALYLDDVYRALWKVLYLDDDYMASNSRVRSAVEGPVFRGCLQGQ